MKHSEFSFIAAGLLAAAAVRAAPVVDIVVDAAHPGPVIGRHLHGQSAGHPGNGHGGVWVGPDSPIPNFKGWRKDAVAALKALRVSLLSWPEGCHADAYDWRDGIGARGQRPATLQLHLGTADDNAVGTHEFFDLVELTGAQAQVNGNVGTGSAREAAQWVEYMVADGGSSLARERAGNGRAEPFKPAYFAVGAAPWSCGGNMTPQYYADLYNQYAVFIRGKGENAPALVASGAGPDWTSELSAKKRIRDYRFGISAHYPGPDTHAHEDEAWRSAVQGALDMGAFIDGHLASLGRNDPARKIAFAIQAPGPPETASQGASLGGALQLALRLHVLHARAGRVDRAILQAPLFQAQGERLVLTPAYHAFNMHVPFQEAVSLPVRLGAAAAVSASAARSPDGKLYLSLVNTDPRQAVEVALKLVGASARAAAGSVLTADSLAAYNSLEAPMAVSPAPVRVRAGGADLRLSLPARSLTVLELGQ